MTRAETAIQLGAASVKIEDSIQSCLNRDQLEVTKKMLKNWYIQCINITLDSYSINKIKNELEEVIRMKAIQIHKLSF